MGSLGSSVSEYSTVKGSFNIYKKLILNLINGEIYRCQYVLEVKWINTTHAIVLWTNRNQKLYVACLHDVLDSRCREVKDLFSNNNQSDIILFIFLLSRCTNKSFRKNEGHGFHVQCVMDQVCSFRKISLRCLFLLKSLMETRVISPTL